MIDPYKFRPSEGWVLILDDPRATQTAGGLFLPGAETGVEKVTEGSGEVIAVGKGDKNRLSNLEKGLRVVYRAFLKHAHRIDAEQNWPDGSEKIFFLIKSEDILAALTPGVTVGVFSGRPQVPAAES